MLTEIVPMFEELIVSFTGEDNKEVAGYAFAQQTSKDLTVDLLDTNHVYNQSYSCLNLSRYDVLINSQSTSDVFIEESFVININICKCAWTLVLFMQSGMCQIDHHCGSPRIRYSVVLSRRCCQYPFTTQDRGQQWI